MRASSIRGTGNAIALRIAALLAPGLAACMPAHAQNYPVKPIRLIVGSSPGGPIDFSARLAAQKLTAALGQSVVVDNRTGASGTIATDYVAKSAPDGYTLLMGSAATLCITPNLYPKIPYDTLRDFAPVTTVTAVSYVVVVHPSVPAASIRDFIALAKARPGELRFGTAGAGSVTHLAVELFRSMAGVEVLHVPYKGAGPALIDLLGGQLDFMFDSLLTSPPFIKAGKLRALAQTGLRRSHMLPDVPTLSETVLPGYEVSTWFGLVAPAATPKDIIARLNAAVVKGLNAPGTRDQLLAQGLDPIGNTPEQFAQLLRSELPKWARIVKISGARIDY
jgi:tripartite-type tricarboxylate transporter receptor subunit TctC